MKQSFLSAALFPPAVPAPAVNGQDPMPQGHLYNAGVTACLAKRQIPTIPCVATIYVTPDIAQWWLSLNVPNRDIRRTRVSNYGEKMAGGNWPLDGQSIKFNWKGQLIDGQHRLLACIKAAVGFFTDVRFGLDPAAYDTQDTGINRNIPDNLTGHNIADAKPVAAAMTIVLRYEKSNFLSLGHRSQMDAREVREAIETRYPNIHNSIPAGRRVHKYMVHALGIGLHCLASHVDPELADLFFEQIANGAGLAADDPANVLRERLRDSRGVTSGRNTLNNITVAALTIKAFNAFIAGRKIRQLKWVRDREAFPTFDNIKLPTKGGAQ